MTVEFLSPASGVAPVTHGIALDNAFFSLDSQAGRPALLVLVGGAPVSAARGVLELLHARAAEFAELGVDLTALVDIESRHVREFADVGATAAPIVFSRPEVFRDWGFSAQTPVLIGLDRGSRVLPAPSEPSEATVAALLEAFAALPREAAHDDLMPAPVLMIPDILSAALCRELIAHFEASAHVLGGMAAVDAGGGPAHKVDQSKKHRFDFVLGPRDPYLNKVMAGIAARCLPAIKKAFQVDIQHTDRILLARYDDSGGYFKRHRDNAAPSIAFRQFALTINLCDDYEGGHLLFPEYNDRRYRPGAGAGVAFSCSLLHEAAPLTRGKRYVALTFLHDAAAQTRWLASTRRAS